MARSGAEVQEGGGRRSPGGGEAVSGKRLVITEKPSVARDIVAALGGFSEEDGFWERDDLVVTFAVGHLLELVEPEDLDPKYKRWTLDTLPILPEAFRLKPKEGSSERLRVIKNLLRRPDVSELVNACDAGREGELIFREIVEHLESTKPIHRLWLQSMTKGAIRDGFGALRDGRDYEGLSAAAHCRNYSDWLIGMNATRALTRRLKSRSENQAWSAGRVQTPTLAMLVDREFEILAHNVVGFWRIAASFSHDGDVYAGTWFDPNFKSVAPTEDEEGENQAKDDRIFEEARALAIVSKLKASKAPPLASETRKPSRETAPPLFDLTSLQREGNRRFGWSARRTLNAAQRCYEGHKILTYPRTDTRVLPQDYRPVVDEVLENLAKDSRFEQACRRLQRDGLLNQGRIFDDSKVTDHFAIVPTGVVPGALDGDDARLFDVVVRRFLAAFHPPAVWSRVERTTVLEGEGFRSRAKTLQEAGWRAVMSDNETQGQASVSLPPLIPDRDEAVDVPVSGVSFEVEADETRPPPRITEARLLTLMETAGKYVEDEEAALAMREKGIGTPATRADTIENLISKGYVVRPGRVLRPTVKGIRLIDILRRMHADRLASPALTGELEQRLADVEHGRRKESDFMSEIYDYTREVVDLTRDFEFDDLFPDDESLGTCPLCSLPVYERSWFYRCKEPAHLARQNRRRPPKQGQGQAPVPVEAQGEVPQAVALESAPPSPAASSNAEEATPPPDCTFRIWKDKAGRYIDRTTVRELLKERISRVLDGFTTRQGRTYKGQLEFENGELALRRVAGDDGGDDLLAPPEYEVNAEPLGTCPTCKTEQVVETRSTFICSAGRDVLQKIGRDETTAFMLKKRDLPEGVAYCSFLMPRTVCKREITREEAKIYIASGQTELLQDFISQRGRPFSATLVLRDTGRHGFEFPPRGEGKSGKSAEASKTPRPSRKTAAETSPRTKPKAARKSEAGLATPKDGSKMRARARPKAKTGTDATRKSPSPKKPSAGRRTSSRRGAARTSRVPVDADA